MVCCENSKQSESQDGGVQALPLGTTVLLGGVSAATRVPGQRPASGRRRAPTPGRHAAQPPARLAQLPGFLEATVLLRRQPLPVSEPPAQQATSTRTHLHRPDARTRRPDRKTVSRGVCGPLAPRTDRSMTDARPAHPDPAPDSFGCMVVAALAGDPLLLAKLRDLLGVPASPPPAVPPAYTVASLAKVLGVSERVVRNAIARGELPAARRGARYVIAAEAIERWAQAPKPPTGQPARQFRRRAGLSEAFDRLPDRA